MTPMWRTGISIHNKLRSPVGFTCMEVIIALAIASIALLALIRLHMISTKTVTSAEAIRAAATLARRKMEQTIAAGFPRQGTVSGTEHAGSAELLWRVRVDDEKPPALRRAEVGPMRKVTVRVEWAANRDRNFEIATYLAERKVP